jgi:tail lysozyme
MGAKPKKKKSVDHSLFKQLAPRMMRDLMRDFSPLADFQVAGAVGNGGGESGGFMQIQELKPTVNGSKGGLGFFQWTGMGTAKKPGRRRAFEALLKKMDRPPNDYDANYEMLKIELKGPEKATITALRKTKDVVEATKMFMVKFERPGIPHFEGRVKWSRMALAAYQAEEAKIAKDPPK